MALTGRKSYMCCRGCPSDIAFTWGDANVHLFCYACLKKGKIMENTYKCDACNCRALIGTECSCKNNI